jgi:hypothetical protein
VSQGTAPLMDVEGHEMVVQVEHPVSLEDRFCCSA